MQNPHSSSPIRESKVVKVHKGNSEEKTCDKGQDTEEESILWKIKTLNILQKVPKLSIRYKKYIIYI